MNKANVKGNSLENLKGEVMIGEMVGSHPHIVHMKEFVENTDRCPAAAASSFHPAAAAAAALSPLPSRPPCSRIPAAPCPAPVPIPSRCIFPFSSPRPPMRVSMLSAGTLLSSSFSAEVRSEAGGGRVLDGLGHRRRGGGEGRRQLCPWASGTSPADGPARRAHERVTGC